jgi:hypothetical protein
MISSLDDLVRYIRATLPYPQSILQLKPNVSAGGVTFLWLGTEFFVKPTLHCLEVRGNSLYVTGLSTLLQSVLMNADQSGRRLDGIVDSLSQAEDQVRVHHQPRAAAQILASVRQVLTRMAGARVAAKLGT